jgi:preprotein translocase subunit YajC
VEKFVFLIHHSLPFYFFFISPKQRRQNRMGQLAYHHADGGNEYEINK